MNSAMPTSLAEQYARLGGALPPLQVPIAPTSDPSTLGVGTMEDLLAKAVEPPTFLIEGLLVEGTANLLVGNSGIGKTPLLVQMGLCVAAGLPFLGMKTSERGRTVLYIDAETTEAQFKQYLTHFQGFLDIPDDTPFHFYSVNWSDGGTGSLNMRRTEQQIDQYRPILVIFDCLRPLWPGLENDSEAAARMWQWQRHLAGTYGCTCLTIHHLRKPGRDKNGDSVLPALQDSPREWLHEAAGTAALINQANTRLGVDFVGKNEHHLVFAGFSKTTGEITPFQFDRVLDGDGEPMGYQPAATRLWKQFRPDYRDAFRQLKAEFRFCDAKGALSTEKPVNNNVVKRFLDTCINCGVVRRYFDDANKPRYTKNAAYATFLDAQKE